MFYLFASFLQLISISSGTILKCNCVITWYAEDEDKSQARRHWVKLPFLFPYSHRIKLLSAYLMINKAGKRLYTIP